jgi:myo-inositol-1(or 4)-monophosphatase
MENSPELSFIVDISLHAGQILREMHRKHIEVQHKSVADLVTAADKAAEEYIINSIVEKFPDHSIKAEESGSHKGNPDHQWFIDPLDGTLNFAHGMSFFSTSIAYAHNGQLELGVVYDPLLDECFTAQRGKGAFMNNHHLRVSSTDQLIDSLLVTGFRFSLKDTPDNNFDNFVRFSHLTQGVRRLGSAALDLCYVAAGRLDGFWEVSINTWDIAAGALIVQEAGGVMTKMYGDPDFMSDPVSILAANPVLHPMFLDVLLEEREKLG